jgi:hypothetical protein
MAAVVRHTIVNYLRVPHSRPRPSRSHRGTTAHRLCAHVARPIRSDSISTCRTTTPNTATRWTSEARGATTSLSRHVHQRLLFHLHSASTDRLTI